MHYVYYNYVQTFLPFLSQSVLLPFLWRCFFPCALSSLPVFFLNFFHFPKFQVFLNFLHFPKFQGMLSFSSKIHSYLNETLLHAIWYTALVYGRIQAVSTCIQIRISRPSLVPRPSLRPLAETRLEISCSVRGRSDGLVTRLIPAQSHGAGCRRGHCRIKMVDNTDNQKKVGNAENSTALCSTRYT